MELAKRVKLDKKRINMQLVVISIGLVLLMIFSR